MINLKKVIHTQLTSDPTLSGVAGGIHTWDDNKDVRDNFVPVFPQITHQEIADSGRTKIWIGVIRVQISAWATTRAEAFEIYSKIVDLFANTGPTQDYKSCTFVNKWESSDPETKTKGIHADFAFVIQEKQ